MQRTLQTETRIPLYVIPALSYCSEDKQIEIWADWYPELDMMDLMFQRGIDIARTNAAPHEESCCNENYITGSCSHSQGCEDIDES